MTKDSRKGKKTTTPVPRKKELEERLTVRLNASLQEGTDRYIRKNGIPHKSIAARMGLIKLLQSEGILDIRGELIPEE